MILKVAKEAQQEERKLWYDLRKGVDRDRWPKPPGPDHERSVADKKPFQAAVKPVWDKYGAQHADLIKRIQDVK